MSNRAFRYAGSKQFLSTTVNEKILNFMPDIKVYAEPFLGSGAIFYNLENSLKDKIIAYLSDINSIIYNMHKAIMCSSFEDYKECLSFVEKEFGDIRTDKEAYYKFRDWWNGTYYKTGLFNTYAYLYLLMLTNSCINSMLRFGPNGMNQSFGHKHYIIKENIWNELNSRLKRANIYISDYSKVFDETRNLDNVVYFLDPPYIDRPMTYNNNFDKDRYIKLLINETCNCNTRKLFLYTDVENSQSDELLKYGWSKEVVRVMRTICPSKHSEITHNEVLYIYKGEGLV